MGFSEKLADAVRRNGSLLCVGLDPDPAQMPVPDVVAFNRALIEATADLVCAYKPNLAFYEALGNAGLRALESTLKAVPGHIAVIGDAKRGDIGNTSRAYAKALFDVWGFDAVTVNPYLGSDSVEPFLSYAGKGVFVLCRTSNPGSAEFQAMEAHSPGTREERPLYEWVALRAASWKGPASLGLVVGATYPDELRRIRSICPGLLFLVPGVGVQGGDLETAVRYSMDDRGGKAIINVSRQVLYASRGADYAEAARRAAQSLRERIRQAMAARQES
ncbi:MAG: orotidine-5'-phosphate decarboxylase [Chloroflexi bacterium]|nr:orotidine-5'-phosphate decarboxylase [Chloroflexota bacterium]